MAWLCLPQRDYLPSGSRGEVVMLCGAGAALQHGPTAPGEGDGAAVPVWQEGSSVSDGSAPPSVVLRITGFHSSEVLSWTCSHQSATSKELLHQGLLPSLSADLAPWRKRIEGPGAQFVQAASPKLSGAAPGSPFALSAPRVGCSLCSAPCCCWEIAHVGTETVHQCLTSSGDGGCCAGVRWHTAVLAGQARGQCGACRGGKLSLGQL